MATEKATDEKKPAAKKPSAKKKTSTKAAATKKKSTPKKTASKRTTKKKTEETKTIRIRQVKSGIGTLPGHRDVLRSLGLRHPNHVVERPDSPAVRGMVNKISYLVEVIEEPS